MERFKRVLLRTSPFSTSALELALMAASEGLNLSPVECLRTRSKVGTDPFFGRPAMGGFNKLL